MNKRVFYFAYGSNMLLERIYNRVGKVKIIGKYSIKNYKLAFNCGYPPARMFANMAVSEGSSIEGVLYELTESQIANLDRYEVYPFNYQKIYMYDNALDAIIFAYVATPDFKPKRVGKPELEYLNILIQGCKDFKLESTLEFLLNYKLNNYKLKNNRNVIDSLKSIPIGKYSFKVKNGVVVKA